MAATSSASSTTRTVPHATSPAIGLMMMGKPTASARRRASAVEATSACRATGSPAAASTCFMRFFSRKFRATASLMPRIPRRPRAVAGGSCICSRKPSKEGAAAGVKLPTLTA
jgi:hypothetical protein